MRRKKKRKLKKKFKILMIALPVTAAIVVLIVFSFQLKIVNVKSDLNQFTSEEVQAYMDEKEIDNTLIFWFKNKIGKSVPIDLFEEYSVKMNSPFEVTITAYEKKIRGCIENDKTYFYFDSEGRILKISSEKIEGTVKVTGLKYDKLVLYKKIYATDKEALETLLNVSNGIEEYDFDVKKIKISEEYEATLFIKNIKVLLGKDSNLEKKLLDLNDMYDNVIKYRGILNMKRVSTDGSYTLKKTKKKKNKNK